jgi:xylulokinase
MPLVAGVDSSTQSCKIVVRDADTGRLVRSGRAPHPEGTEVDPRAWWAAFEAAAREADGLDDVAALAVGAQQHGLVALDEAGHVVRPALLWNDTRSAPDAIDLIAELGGPGLWAEAVGVVPVASFTVTKLRWLARVEPELAARVAAVVLPHDWLTWRIAGGLDPTAVTTDRGDASGTGYWSAASGRYREDLLELALGRRVGLPRVAEPVEVVGRTPGGATIGAGTGDNAAAALGVGAGPGDVVVSIGTSGVVSAVADRPSTDPTGVVAGFADATGRFLPLVCTLNAARVLDAVAAVLGVDHAELSRLALSAPPGADGLAVVPYLDGERTPDRPDASGAVHGMTHRNATAAHVARAAVEGVLCGLAAGLDAVVAQGVVPRRVLLVGGGARSEAVRRIAPAVLGLPVDVPAPGEYVADGAARQSAWALAGGAEPPGWPVAGVDRFEADAVSAVRDRYAEVADLVARRR